MARPASILTIAFCVAAHGLAGCASEDATLASPAEVAQPAPREVTTDAAASPWSVRSGSGHAVSGDEGPASPAGLVWGTGEMAPTVAAVLPAEIQFSGLYTAIATTGMVSLAWDAPTTNADGSAPVDDLAGYTISWGPTSSDLSTNVNVGNVTSFELELPIGTHFVAVRAFDTWENVSAPSNVIQVTVAGPS